ncbi:MAG: hypothetical protein ABGW78_10785, partial [Pirellulales bacterium]
KIDSKQNARIEQTEAMLGQFIGQLDGVGEHVGKKVEEGWLHVTETMHAKHADQAAQLNAMLTHNRDEITAIAVDAESARERASQLMSEAAEDVKSFSDSLKEGLSGLAATLEKLNGKTVSVEMKSRSWFGLGGGKTRKPQRNSNVKFRS